MEEVVNQIDKLGQIDAHNLTSRATRMTLFFEEILFSNFLTNNIIDQFIIVVK